MKKRSLSIPSFFVDSLPDIPDTDCRDLLRCIEIQANPPDIFVWLNQMRIAPYSFDLIDNRGRRSPNYIVENLPPLKMNTHFLLSFHVVEFKENSFITGRFCLPINPPMGRYMKDMFIEYRITEQGTQCRLWCKIKGYINRDISSKGFFYTFSVLDKIMMARQLKNVKRLAEKLAIGEIKTGIFDFTDCYPKSGIHWWLFCRRQGCMGLTV